MLERRTRTRWPSNFLCINQVRNGQAISLISGSGAATTAQLNSKAPSCGQVRRYHLGSHLAHPAMMGEVLCLGTDTTLTTLVTVTALTTPENQTLAAASLLRLSLSGTSTCFQFTNAHSLNVQTEVIQ